MSNTFFRFKQFAIAQDKCAMKGTTDACIMGAWAPIPVAAKRVLDIGTGTGLLSLMLAQRNEHVTIDAIDIDAGAVLQARENAAASPWADRVAVHQGDIRAYTFAHKFGFIITNPPFFNNSLLGPQDSKNMARHTVSLSYNELLAAIAGNLAPDGTAAILLPHTEHKIWESLLTEQGWQVYRKLCIKHKAGTPVKRVISLFGKAGAEAVQEEETLIIKDSNDSYSADFSRLLQPYYLHL